MLISTFLTGVLLLQFHCLLSCASASEAESLFANDFSTLFNIGDRSTLCCFVILGITTAHRRTW
jgi:hypothetical protein